ncbi:tetraspannin, putative [Bodo saltans]|uniref:Tetraspannin, putative n=1 Tax=Bodo saltans TaxID=75058 RepID=A0A0S4IZV0_BODSA|nr:tetraspannin, putative [Bodo saltans]|eukprot:CUG69457.1 tetraspannin, putative [Bodo saltans]
MPSTSTLSLVLIYIAAVATCLVAVSHATTIRKARSQHLTTETSTYVSIKVTDVCRFALHEVRPTTSHHFSDFEPSSHHPQPHGLHDHNINPSHFGTTAYTQEYFSHRLRVSYIDVTTGVEMFHVQPDPRIIYLDTHGDDDPTHTAGGGSATHNNHNHHHDESVHNHHDHHHGKDQIGKELGHLGDEGYLMMYIPSNVPKLSIHCHNMSVSLDIHLPMTRDGSETHAPLRKHFNSLDAGDGIQLMTLRVAGPAERVNSIVFLSDGYLASDNQTFFDKVNSALSTIDASYNDEPTIQTMKATVPFGRYVAFWNVYAIFQPSPQAGASRPLYNLVVNDNLGCYHTPQLERAIACDRSKSMSLARVAPIPEDPDNFLIVVLVNTVIYGGTGLFQAGTIHIGQFFGGIVGTTPMADNQYASLVNHECGHAFGQLLDEYAIGLTANAPYVQWSNCVQPSTSNGNTWATPLPWQLWIDIYTGTNATLIRQFTANYDSARDLLPQFGYGTLQTPQAVCGYNNYYKGSNNCMMNRLNDFFMCPQCREGYSKAIFNTNFEYQWPRRPLLDQILVLSRFGTAAQGIAAGGATLHLPASLDSAGSFTIEWRDENNVTIVRATDANCPTCLFIPASTLSTWPLDTIVTYSAIIRDQSVFIQPAARANIPMMTQTAVFRMVIPTNDPASGSTPAPGSPATTPAPTSANASTPAPSTPIVLLGAASFDGNVTVSLTTSLPTTTVGTFTVNTVAGTVDRLGFYYQCVAYTSGINATCELGNGTASQYVYVSDIDALAEYDAYVLYILAGVAVVLVFLWLYASMRYKKVAGRVVRPIFKTEFSAIVTLIRRVMMVSSVLFMVAAVGALVTSGYFYTKTSFVGKVIIIGGVIISLILYAMAFIGFWAITNRAKRLVMANGVVMIVAEVLLIAALALCNIVCEQIIDDYPLGDFDSQMTNWWRRNTADDPTYICGWQNELYCSGWGNYSCSGSFVDPTNCPPAASCSSNQYGTSCQVKINEIVDQWYPIVFAILIVCVVLMAFAVVFNYVYYFSLWSMKQQFRARNNERVYKATARKGIARADVDKAKALHVLRTLDVGDLQHLVKEFRRIDEDGNGSLDMKELGIFFRKALCYKITMVELKQIFEAMDIDGDGTISVDEFLAVFRSEDLSGARGANGAVLQYPAGEMPLVAGSTLERQQKVRERLESTFNASVFDGAPRPTSSGQHITFSPQAMNVEGYVAPHHGAPQAYYAAPPPTQQQPQQYAQQQQQVQYAVPAQPHKLSRSDSL